jgi:hypothetical protein
VKKDTDDPKARACEENNYDYGTCVAFGDLCTWSTVGESSFDVLTLAFLIIVVIGTAVCMSYICFTWKDKLRQHIPKKFQQQIEQRKTRSKTGSGPIRMEPPVSPSRTKRDDFRPPPRFNGFSSSPNQVPADHLPTKTSNNIMLDISDGENPIQIVLDKPVTNPLAEKVG